MVVKHGLKNLFPSCLTLSDDHMITCLTMQLTISTNKQIRPQNRRKEVR